MLTKWSVLWSMCNVGSSFRRFWTMVVTRMAAVESGDDRSKPRSLGIIVRTVRIESGQAFLKEGMCC